MESNVESSLFELQVDHEATNYLKETARWAKFMAIMGFIGCGICVLVGLFAGSIIAGMYSSVGGVGRAGAMGGAFYSILYIALALLYFFPCLYTFNFASKMQVALRSNDQSQLNLAFKNLKSCYRFVGILTIIWLCLVGLGVIFSIIGLAFR